MFTDELAASAETMKDLPGLFNPCLLSKVSYHLVPFTFFFYVCDFSLKIFIKKREDLTPNYSIDNNGSTPHPLLSGELRAQNNAAHICSSLRLYSKVPLIIPPPEIA